MERLIGIMAALRDPERGCPWDLEQDFASIAPYTLEEAYEVADAIERNDLEALREELGDLLLQVVFHAQMARERGAFGFDEVAAGICDKMVRRHPHVFADARVESAAEQTRAWEEIKAAEKAARGAGQGLLDDVPVALPALTRAGKFGRRAAQIGFDWPDAAGPRAKIDEELAELDAVVAAGGPAEALEAEIGDLLFSVANLARHHGVDPEAALRGANARFARRFRHVERRRAEGGHAAAGLDQLEAWWQEAKSAAGE
jgi:MazG family protein